MTIPTYLPYFVATGTAVTVVAILYGLNQALAGAAWPERDRAEAVLASSAVLIGWLAAAVALGAAGIYHVSAERNSHDPIRHLAADSDRRPHDLAIGSSQADPRRRAAILDRRRPALSRARRDLLDPLRKRQTAEPLCLAGRFGRHRHRSSCPRRWTCLCAGAARGRGARESVERVWHSRPRRRGDDGVPDRALLAPAHRDCSLRAS